MVNQVGRSVGAFGDKTCSLLITGMLLTTLLMPSVLVSKAEALSNEEVKNCGYYEQECRPGLLLEKNAQSVGLSDRELQLLLALRFDNWRFLKLPEFRDKVLEVADTAEYGELLNRLVSEDELIKSSMSPDLASFAYDVLLPLISDEWLDQNFSGEVFIEPIDSRDKARVEYTFRVKLVSPERIRVGDYQDSVAVIPQMFVDLLYGRTVGELSNATAIDEETTMFVHDLMSYADTPEMIVSEVNFAYFAPEAECGDRKDELDPTLSTKDFEAETVYSVPSVDDYVSLLALKTPHYKNKSVAEFNNDLLVWANDNQTRSERISEAVARGSLSEYLTNDERQFIDLTVTLSGEENHQFVVSEYTGRPLEAPCFYETLPQRTCESRGRAAWCELYYQYTYLIPDRESVTVGERDECVECFRQTVAAYWDNADFEELLKMDEVSIVEVLQELATQCSTSNVVISVRDNHVSFESMDERDRG